MEDRLQPVWASTSTIGTTSARTRHIGTYAEDFNQSLGLPDKPVIEFPDMFGALTGAIQSLDKKVQAIGGKEKG
jgi:hypothetical protein